MHSPSTANNKYEIKKILPSDVEQAVNIYNKSLSFLSREYPVSGEIFLKIIQDPKNILLGAYRDKCLLGHLLVREINEGVLDIGIVIDRDYQNQGIGSQLLEKILKDYGQSKKIFADILEYNTNSQEFFKNNGFCPLETDAGYIEKGGRNVKLIKFQYCNEGK